MSKNVKAIAVVAAAVAAAIAANEAVKAIGNFMLRRILKDYDEREQQRAER
jgi:aldehyde:ferredoxin oxidoreductase